MSNINRLTYIVTILYYTKLVCACLLASLMEANAIALPPDVYFSYSLWLRLVCSSINTTTNDITLLVITLIHVLQLKLPLRK
jgi:hypothetical protein